MALRIHKYGGTSVDGPDKVRSCARRIAEDVADGHRVVVVVSAAGKTTDRLEEMAREITPDPPRREMDMLLTAGERISMALLSMALHEMDIRAISFTGSQSGIITDTEHQQARIHRIRPFRILEELNRGRVVIVAGFQGVSQEKEITTLGRGGSDTTAVALAAVFQAPWCAILTDVPGVLSADPRVVPGARPVPALSLDALLLLCSLGAGVVSARAAALARKMSVPLLVAHAHSTEGGTWALPRTVTRESPDGRPPEGPAASHLTFREIEPVESSNILSITIVRPVWRLAYDGPSDPELPAGLTALQFQEGTVDGRRMVAAVFQGEPPADPPGAGARVEPDLALVSCVGESSVCDPARVAAGAAALRAAGCETRGTFAHTLALSFLVPARAADDAARALHAAFIGSA